jgi:hypothetical protein
MIRIAKVFDGAADGVPYYAADHPRLDPPVRDDVLAYLDAGAPLLVSPELEPDFVDPSRGAVVPVNFRTDGSWVWNDALAYYVAEYGYAPEPEFLAAMEAAEYECPVPSPEAMDRALDELLA